MDENLNNDEILIPDIEESDFVVSDIAQNKLTAKFKLIAVSKSEVLTEVTPRVPEKASKATEIYSRAIGLSYKETLLDVKHRGYNSILTEIQPIGNLNLDTEIEVRPHNKMWAIYEVQRPPIVTSILNPTQDSFTREKSEFQSINYGSSSSMVVGRYGDDIWRSFVQFGLSGFDPSFILTDSKLRLYYKGSIPKILQLEILNSDKTWFEYSITHLNRPNPIKLISNEFTIDEARGFVEFDVLDIVKTWLSKAQDNNGFIIRVANESQDGQTTFYTRETPSAPELVIKYFDSTIFSHSRTQVVTEINVMKFGESLVDTELEVHSTHNLEYLDAEIYVHRVEVPLDDDILTEITASCSSNVIELIVSISVDNNKDSEVSVRVPKESSKNVELAVSRQVVPIEIFVKYQNKIDTEVIVQRYENYDLFTEITVTKDTHYVEVYVKYRNDVETEITVQRFEDNDILTEITAKRDFVSSEIYVKHKIDIPTEIYSKAYDISDLDTEITSSRQVVPTEIFVKYKDEKDVELYIRAYTEDVVLTEIASSRPIVLTEIRATKFVADDIVTEITFNRPNIDTEITVTQNNISTEVSSRVIRNKSLYTEISSTRPQVQTELTVKYRSEVLTEITPNIKSDILTEILIVNANVTTIITARAIGENDLESEIFVRYNLDIPTEITFKAVDQILTEIFANSVSQVETEILHSKDRVPTVITIPTWVDWDLKTEIQPRIFMVSNIPTRIQVGSVGGAYAFII